MVLKRFTFAGARSDFKFFFARRRSILGNFDCARRAYIYTVAEQVMLRTPGSVENGSNAGQSRYFSTVYLSKWQEF